MWTPVLALAVLLACASTETSKDDADLPLLYQGHSRVMEEESTPSCQYGGRYFKEGAVVTAQEACLRCLCGRGAISCRRRACAPLPEPPPPSCHVVHRREACCPEMHCLDGTITMERDALARFEEVYPDVSTSTTNVFPVCVENGTAYAAGSAMSSRTACEQCFCLGGARRCVRPKCLPAPFGCRARPAPGVCCPQRYYCNYATKPPEPHVHDCKVEGKWVAEGERVPSPDYDEGAGCSQCFCLRGSVRCQSLACAPPLLGCKPLLAQGQCCPHQYKCDHQRRDWHQFQPISDNALISLRGQDRSFRNAQSRDNRNTTIFSSTVTAKTTPSVKMNNSITTIKVKRKTSDPPLSFSHKPDKNVTTTTLQTTKATVETTASVTEATFPDDDATEQPEGSVKIIINGTINCTAELSSSTVTVNSTKGNEAEKYVDIIDIQPRIPNISSTFESHTYNPNDIITDRNYNEDFDENESYIINVTSSLISSLRTKTTFSTITPTSTVSPEVIGTTNTSNKTKEDYEYNYRKPTLPPSLPNLKIIPFVAADAVVDEDISSKGSLTYPMLDREDKYPVYYPSVEAKDIPFATRRGDLYNPTQFPIFLSKNVEPAQYPLSGHDVHITNEFTGNGDVITSLHEYTATTSVGNNIAQANKEANKLQSQNTKFELETPAVNLFSPPIETEGGFIPKDSGIIEDYYAAYPSTPPGSHAPHLTTSMQLDTIKECVSGDGRAILEGESISIACSVCTCAWGDLHCSQRPCPNPPPGCKRRTASSTSPDLCCGDLICDQGNKTTPVPLLLSTRSVQVTLNNTHNSLVNNTELMTESSLLNKTTVTTQPKITLNYSTTIDDKTYDSEVAEYKSEPNSTEINESNKSTTAVEESDTYSHNSQEYDDEEDEEGFSFGSVLKLLLSDSYETTTAASVKQPTTPVTKLPAVASINTTELPTTKRQSPKSPMAAPVTHHPPYIPPKTQQSQNIINRIDHLVLGETNILKTTTARPATNPFKPIAPRKPLPIKNSTTQKSSIPSKPVEVTKKTDFGQYTSVPQENIRPSTFNYIAGLGPGLLKLAGCNIYGQMYRVGRIIAELSTPCQECRCTEIGVQCRQLSC